jgi:peroxiredoxin
MPAWTKLALLVGVIVLASIGIITSMRNQLGPLKPLTAEQADADEIAARQPVADFILTEENGTQKKLSDFRGNVVILSFWASWCGPCLTELPTFAEMEKKFHDRGLRVIPVNVDDGDEGKQFAKDFWAKKSIAFPSFFDTSKNIAQAFEVDMLPSNFIIDRQGRMVFSSAGASDWSAPETLELIESVLQEPAQAAPSGS